MGGASVQEQNRKGVARMIIDLRGFILKGIFGYEITKWQLKKEEGRGKDTIQCLLLKGVATRGWFLLDSFWLKRRTLLGTCHIQGAELSTRRLSRKTRTNVLQMTNDFYSLWLASTLIFSPPHWPEISRGEESRGEEEIREVVGEGIQRKRRQ